MSRRMNDDEWRAFVSHGTRTGKLAVTRRDGRPHVVPVWFVLDGDDVVFTSDGSSLKTRALRRERRACICVDLEHPPYAYVQLSGPVSLSEDVEEMLPLATRIGRRYMGDDRAEEFGRRNAVPGELLVRLHIETIVAVGDIVGY
jgi:PPOX class probable F420-dependent enzyme